jgi:hypothetical protein
LGTGVARGRSRPVSRRMNCHQMKKAVDSTKSTADTQAFTRSGPYLCAGSIRSSSSKKRPTV